MKQVLSYETIHCPTQKVNKKQEGFHGTYIEQAMGIIFRKVHH